MTEEPAHRVSPVLLTSSGRASLSGRMVNWRVAATEVLSLSGHSRPAVLGNRKKMS